MKKYIFIVLFLLTGSCFADCSYDHLFIGCNADGITGTADDNTLFVECTQKYRHSTPDYSGDDTWLNWHYPLYYDSINGRYSISEPGFEVIEADDPNRRLAGIADVDYRIIIECVSIKSGFSARRDLDDIVVFGQPGDFVNHSALAEDHLHLNYCVQSPHDATDLHWITYRLYDALGKYESSEPFSVVFVKDPPAGDLVIDGIVNICDLAEFCHYWLVDSGGRANDYYERADANKNGKVDFADFALLAENW
ncbi:MAG: dockerin type I domain-containing protein [Sedimentisphaerales bacterium]